MTIEEFREKNCKMCGSQRCFSDEESISICDRYEGNIPGIEKKESLLELLERINKKTEELLSTTSIIEKLSNFKIDEIDLYLEKMINYYNSIAIQTFYKKTKYQSVEIYGKNLKFTFEDNTTIILPPNCFISLIKENIEMKIAYHYLLKYVTNINKMLQGEI